MAVLFNLLLILLLPGLKLIGYIFYWNLCVEKFLPCVFVIENGTTVLTVLCP